MAKITVENSEITVVKVNDEDYLSLTDMMKANDGDFFFHNWLRNRNTIEFLGVWEKVYNPDFNSVEFDRIKSMAGLNNFRISAKEWIESTNAIGLIAKAGRYGGTYAHKDLAMEFAMWISPEFKVYLIREFQRLKEAEQKQLGWTAKRELSKINYRIHTDAIKNNLIPEDVTSVQANVIYADEADVLNVAMFGMTAKMWRDQNPDLKGNIRDYANINQLICLSNMENLNAVFIEKGMTQSERLIELNKIAIHQMKVLEKVDNKEILKYK
ncbi:MAG: KilA-N domain-containing protein [Paludibacteraceae bacterium]|nr:KilA-N domain-containing protein [Paludibacteraceae bacterium]